MKNKSKLKIKCKGLVNVKGKEASAGATGIKAVISLND